MVLAALNRQDDHHRSVAEWIRIVEDDLVTTPLAVAEMDHLAARLGGAPALDGLWRDLDSGAYLVEWWPDAMHETLEIARRHASWELGLTDASLVALAGRGGTTRIATLDERHFRTLSPLSGEPAFTLLPADAE